MEAARALAVKAKVLGVALCQHQSEALLDEVADRPRVAGQVTRREALVRAVEEGEVLPFAHNVGDGFPLILGGVHARRVVGAGVEEHYAVFRGSVEGGEHAIEVEGASLWVEVGVRLDGEADVGEDLVVVGPCRVAEVDGGRGMHFAVELGEEEGSEVDGARAGDGLEGGDPFLFDCGAVGAENELLRR